MKNKAPSEQIGTVQRNRRSPGKAVLWIAVCAAVVVLAGLFLAPLFFEYYVDGFGIHQASSDAWVREILWETPNPLSREISATVENYEPTVSADGTMLIFTGGKASDNADLYISRRQDRKWGEPVLLDGLNSEHDELGPELSRDGQYLYFYSNRPGGIGGYDVWVSRWNGEGWNAPENLGTGVNSEFNEYGPGVTPDGNELYFSSNRLERELTPEEKAAWKATLRENFVDNDYDIYRAVTSVPAGIMGEGTLPVLPQFQEAKRVEILNSIADDGQVAMTRRGDFLYFSSNRQGGVGRFDVYRSRIFFGELLEPENLGEPVNSRFDDMDPALLAEGYGLVFSSNRQLVDGRQRFDIYQTFSREVITQNDYSALSAFFKALDKIKWPLLLLLLGLLALLLLLRYLKQQRFGMYASLLHRCLLLSLLIHLLLALLTSTWMVGSSLYDLAWEDQGELCLNLDALSEEQIGLDIREQVVDLDEVSDTPIELVAQDSMTMEHEIEPQSLAKMEFEAIEPEENTFALSIPMASMAPVVEAPLPSPEHMETETLETLSRPESRLDVPEPREQEAEQDFASPADPMVAHQNSRAVAEETPAEPVVMPQFNETSQATLDADSALYDPVQPRSLPRDVTESLVRTHTGELPYSSTEPDLSNLALEVPERRRDHFEDEQKLQPIKADVAMQDEPVPIKENRLASKKPIRELPELKAMAATPTAQESAVSMARSENVAAPSSNEEPLAELEIESSPQEVPSSVEFEMETLKPAERKREETRELAKVIPDAPADQQSRKIEMEEVALKPVLKEIPLELPREKSADRVTRTWADQLTPKRDKQHRPEVALHDPAVEPRRKMDPLKEDPRPLLEKFEKKPVLTQKVKKEFNKPAHTLPERRIDRNPLTVPTRVLPVPSPDMAMKKDPPLPVVSALDHPDRAAREDTMPEVALFEHDSPPTYHGLEMRSRRVVFCLDVSSSMDWNHRIRDARQELLRLLDTLDSSVEFNIITFSGRVRVWDRRGVRPGTEENVASAKQFVRKARIASDGTNTVDALVAALADKDVESIFFLSDGHPTAGSITDNEGILRRVKRKQAGRNVIIHTIAYIKGDPPAQWRNRVPPKDRLIDLMTRLAEENNGNCVVIDEK